MRPKRVFVGELVEALTRDGDSVEVLLGKSAGFDTYFKDSSP